MNLQSVYVHKETGLIGITFGPHIKFKFDNRFHESYFGLIKIHWEFVGYL